MRSNISLFIFSCTIFTIVGFTSNLERVFIDIDKSIESFKLSELYKSVKLIPLETNEYSLIGEIRKVVEYGNYYLIIDKYITQSVYVFDKGGCFIQKIGNNSDGPEGFEIPTDITIVGDELYLLDGQRLKINIYDLNTFEHVANFKLNFTALNMEYFDDKFYFISFDEPYYFTITDLDMNIINTSVEAKLESRKINLIAPFSKSNNEMFCRLSLDNNVYALGDAALPVIEFDFKENNFRKFKKKLSIDDLNALYAHEKYVTYLQSLNFTKNDIYLTYRINRETHHTLIDRKSKEYKTFNSKSVENDVTFSEYIPWLPFNGNNDNLIGYVMPHTISNTKVFKDVYGFNPVDLNIDVESANPILIDVRI